MITQVSEGELNKNRYLMRTKRGKACVILIFQYEYKNVEPWPIDPSGLRSILPEVSEKLPQG